MKTKANKNHAIMTYTEVSTAEIDDIKGKISFLIVTATNLETKIVHENMSPLPGFEHILKMYQGNLTYYIGCFGAYGVIQVQCGTMGSISSGASITTAIEAIGCWEPKAVVMIGIAFGKNKEKQNIGDVLLSEAIIPYNIQRVGKEQIVYRSPIPPASGVLLNRFKNFREWDYNLPGNKKAKIIPCQVLSGESLVDNIEYRDELFGAFPNACGGEMEGAGLYAAAANKNLEWIVVKGICDYADGNKSENKAEYQAIAAKSATSFCLGVFSSKYAFEELGFVPIYPVNQSVVATGLIEDPEIVNKVLFGLYQKDCEDYYIERDCDHEIGKLLDFCGLWVSGPTGCGKTCSILRNLIQAGKRYIYVLLGCCIGWKVEELFNYIYSELLYILERKNSNYEGKLSVPQITKALSELFRNHVEKDEIYIFIEEIPISRNDDFEEFVSKISSIFITILEKNPDLNLKFILSSINGPKEYIESHQKKIYETIKFRSYDYWENSETQRLLEMIVEHLNIPFSKKDKQLIIEKSKGSPRFIKTFIRNYISSYKNSNRSLIGIIEETRGDLDG